MKFNKKLFLLLLAIGSFIPSSVFAGQIEMNIPLWVGLILLFYLILVPYLVIFACIIILYILLKIKLRKEKKKDNKLSKILKTIIIIMSIVLVIFGFGIIGLELSWFV